MAHRIQTGTDINESEADAIERDAFNAAFRELGLRWYWDAATFQALKPVGSDRERICKYLETREPHLLKAYDAAFLADAVEAVKARAALPDIPGSTLRRYPDCADFATAQTGF